MVAGQSRGRPAQTAAAEAPAADAPASAAPQTGLVGAIEPVSAPAQNWLITPGGGLVDRDTVRAWLRQDRLVEERYLDLAFSAPLSALLAPGESLPAPVYRPVFADIRAKALATGLCQPLVDTIAAACAVHRAVVPEGGVSEDGLSAAFGFRLVYTLKPEAGPLPDLASHVLHEEYTGLADRDPTAEQTATPQAFLAWALAEMPSTCPESGLSCRILSMNMIWKAPGDVHATARIGWLMPLPAGMYPAPPLETAPVEE